MFNQIVFTLFFVFINLRAGATCTDEAFLRALSESYGVVGTVTRVDYKIGDKLPQAFQDLKKVATKDGNVFEVKYLDKGAYGAVYDVTLATDQKLILKLPKDSSAAASIVDELKQYEKLKSSSIPHARVTDADPKGSFIVKEKIEGTNLASAVDNYNDAQLAQLAHIYKQSKMHNIVLDLKKDNFILAKNGEITLIDFGYTQAAATYQMSGRSLELWRRMFSSTEEFERFKRLTNAP